MTEQLIKKYFKDNSEALKKIKNSIEPTVSAISGGARMMLKINPLNIEQIKNLQVKMTGHCMILQELIARIDCLKKNKELAIYESIKDTTEKEGKKFTSAPTERKAALLVGEERELRNYISGYLSSVSECLRTCRNIINEKHFFAPEERQMNSEEPTCNIR